MSFRSEYGLNSFLPSILLENVKRREIRKHVRYYLKRDSVKLNESLAKQGGRCDGQQGEWAWLWKTCGRSSERPALSVSALLSLRVTDASVSLRVRYLELLAHLPSFGGRGFSVTFKESQIDMIMQASRQLSFFTRLAKMNNSLQVDPKAGLLVRHPGKTGRPTISIDFDLIDRLVVRRDSEIASLISIRLKSSPDQGLEFLVDKDDIDDLVGYICGYQLIHCDRHLTCDFDDTPPPMMRPQSDRKCYCTPSVLWKSIPGKLNQRSQCYLHLHICEGSLRVLLFLRPLVHFSRVD